MEWELVISDLTEAEREEVLSIWAERKQLPTLAADIPCDSEQLLPL